MGTYFRFETKPLKLKRETPKEIIDFLDERINKQDYNVTPPSNHPFFTKERWGSVFNHHFDLKPPYFKIEEGKLPVLYINCDVKSGYFEIEQFVDFISPFVVGHKPKEYIGCYNWDDNDDKRDINLYIERN